MTEPFWVIRHGTPILASTIGIKRAWHHLRSGHDEWKEQNPTKFTHESQAWWNVLVAEVEHEQWRGWYSAKGKDNIMDHVKKTAACERIYDVCCKYHRAIVQELTPPKRASDAARREIIAKVCASDAARAAAGEGTT